MIKKDVFNKAEDAIGILGIKILYKEFLKRKRNKLVKIHKPKQRWRTMEQLCINQEVLGIIIIMIITFVIGYFIGRFSGFSKGLDDGMKMERNFRKKGYY